MPNYIPNIYHIASVLLGVLLGLLLSVIVIVSDVGVLSTTASVDSDDREHYIVSFNRVQKMKADRENIQNKSFAHSIILSGWSFKIKDMPKTKERDAFAINVLNAIKDDHVADDEFDAIKLEFERLNESNET